MSILECGTTLLRIQLHATPTVPPTVSPQATAAAEEQRLKEALRKAARAAESSGHQAQQAQRGQQPAPMSPRQAQLAAAPKQPLYPMFEKHPAKKAAVAGGGGRPAAAPAPGLAKSAPRRIMDLSDSDSEDEFVPTKPSSKQHGPAKRPSAAASKPPGGAATSKKRKASVIDDSQSESGSDNENASAAGQAGQQSGRAAAAEMQRLSADLQDAVQLRMSAERRLRQAQAAEAELQRRLSGQGPTPGAAAQGGSGAVRSARAARRAAPVSYRDDSDEDGQDEGRGWRSSRRGGSSKWELGRGRLDALGALHVCHAMSHPTYVRATLSALSPCRRAPKHRAQQRQRSGGGSGSSLRPTV